MIEKTVELGFLFDFYGNLLSKRQYSIVELFYIHDLSLTEIGEEMGISRQSVYDTLKRGEKKLYEYEETLGLFQKFDEKEENIKEILKDIEEIEKNAIKNNIDKILDSTKKIKSSVNYILENNREV